MNTRVYIGYYKSQKIIIATQKKVIKNYLQLHRGLTKKEYEIEEEFLPEYEILGKYEDLVVQEYDGYYLPSIDSEIMELYENPIEKELSESANTLKKLILLTKEMKKVSKKDTMVLHASLQLINAYLQDPKILDELNEKDQMTSSILYSPMEIYLKEVSRYREIRDMQKIYRNKLDMGP